MNFRSCLHWLALSLLALLVASTPRLSTAQEVVSLDRFEPASNGWVISNPQLQIGVFIDSEGTEFAKGRAGVSVYGGTLEGYKYGGEVITEQNKGEWCHAEGQLDGCHVLSGDITDHRSHPGIRVSFNVTHKGRTVASFSDKLVTEMTTSQWRQDVPADHRRSDYAITNLRISSTQDVSTENAIKSALRAMEKAEEQAQRASSEQANTSSEQTTASSEQRGKTSASAGTSSAPAASTGQNATATSSTATRNTTSSAVAERNAQQQKKVEVERRIQNSNRYLQGLKNTERSYTEQRDRRADAYYRNSQQRRQEEEQRIQRELQRAKAAEQQRKARMAAIHGSKKALWTGYYDESNQIWSQLQKDYSNNSEVGTLESMMETAPEGSILYYRLFEMKKHKRPIWNMVGKPGPDHLKVGASSGAGRILINERSRGVFSILRKTIYANSDPAWNPLYMFTPDNDKDRYRYSERLILASMDRYALNSFISNIGVGQNYRYLSYGAMYHIEKYSFTHDFSDLGTERQLSIMIDRWRFEKAIKKYPDIFTALEANELEALEAHLKRGAKVTARNAAGFTPLHLAITAEAARMLLDHGADVEVRGGLNSATPLHNAAITGDLELVRVLLEAGANPHARTDPGFKPSFYARSGTDLHVLLKEYEDDQPEEEAEEQIFFIVEKQPSCRATTQLMYPTEARTAGIEGSVHVSFVVEKDGQVTTASVVRTPNPLLNEAAIRYIQGLNCSPGQQRGEPARVKMTVPLRFALN